MRRGLAPSRQRARELVESHKVRVNGAYADKTARLVDRGDAIEIEGDGPRFVSRGGEKLAGALDAFQLDPSGSRCLDAGASTGGFTDCLLQRGAAEVLAVDVGYGQLHESLVADARVHNIERTNIRHLQPGDLGDAVDLVVGDLSFISLGLVLGPLVGLARAGASLVMLVKPQFEAGRREVSRGSGVVRDPEVWRRVLEEVADAGDEVGAGVVDAAVSPIRGGNGNVEFLYRFAVGAERGSLDLDGLVASVPDA